MVHGFCRFWGPVLLGKYHEAIVDFSYGVLPSGRSCRCFSSREHSDRGRQMISTPPSPAYRLLPGIRIQFSLIQFRSLLFPVTVLFPRPQQTVAASPFLALFSGWPATLDGYRVSHSGLLDELGLTITGPIATSLSVLVPRH